MLMTSAPLARFCLLALFGPLVLVIPGRAAESPAPTAPATTMIDNPLLQESSLDFHYPPFDRIKDEHYAPAYEKGMADQLQEIEPIASNAEAPTFENTIVALETT